MTEPTTANTGFIVPNTGDLPGAWGTAALNVNWQSVDGYFGGTQQLTLSGATTVTLTTNGASFTPGAGPNQTSNAAIVISGSPTGTATINFTVPGVYRVLNNMGFSTFPVKLTGGGNVVCAPPGEFRRFYFDGTNFSWMDMPHMGSYMNLCVSTSPVWMTACTTPPWLPCLGGVFNQSQFPFLATLLGSTWGGNGVTTFGVPDSQSRVFLMLDVNGVNRVTSGGSGISGNALTATGGNELLQSHSHANTLTDPGHVHSGQVVQGSGTGVPVNSLGGVLLPNTGTAVTGITINNVAAGSGLSQNMPPAFVGGITFIKT